MEKTIKKKIIISSYDDQKNPVYSGGGAHSVHQLSKRLAKKYEVTVLTGTFKKAKNEVIDKVKYIRIGSDILGHKIGQLIYQYHLIRYARENNYDVWIEGSTPPFTFSLLPLFARKPLISWIHMICGYDMQRKYNLNFARLEQELSKFYQYIIVPTDWVKNEVMTMNPRAEIFTITPGFDLKPCKKKFKKIASLGDYLLFIGRIEINQKGLDLLLEALQYTYKNTQVVIAGSGSKNEEKKLSVLIAKYKVADKIKRIGRIKGQEKEAFFKYAKAVIIPSRFETFSLTALEAILYEKPVICFNIPQLNWISAKYAYKIDPFKIPELAYSIDKALFSKIYKNISESEKKEYLKKVSWKNIAGYFDELITKIAL